MKLHLIDDLPLFLMDPASRTPCSWTRRAINELAATAPAELTYVSCEELERLWRKVLADQVDRILVVGTRPPLLTRRTSPLATDRMVRVVTNRVLDETGRTAFVNVIGPADGPATCPSGRLLIVDDVAMSGRTLLAVLDALGPAAHAASVSVTTAFATRRAVECVHRVGVRLSPVVTLDYEPIKEGTAIFLHDLLYGTLRGARFLDQTDLLRPYLGTNLTPLRNLRRALDDSGLSDAGRLSNGSTDA